ncbi:hypothetical protein B0T22DRAFT_103003 [Podospora appendiculata]|uniref:F-box domain-containing protein n=1 Tax=Podospora appendiculata TaxID=314037 RepID=A0AAE0XLB3_9PEZI|nr:hypothetical protein B0T22DRAFT_103003 [Podospora appendiculata]
MATVGAADEDGTRRPSIEKTSVITADPFDTSGPPAAFERLPDEIIQQILQVTDSNGFASLALLNTKWRSVAQQAHLYAHHLSSCPSYSSSHHATRLPPPVSQDELPRLRRLFAKEVKRNLFEAYLRPNKTVVKLISNSISSSSCPGGEGIQFSCSPKGHHVLAYNSSRIHVVDVRQPEIAVTREFKILRRPAATCINDEGSTLAVLLTEMQVDIYDLTTTPPKRSQSMLLDHSPRAIALSPCGSVLAAAYEGGIEVSSLNPGALSTDRRAVKCDAVDALAFSCDGTQILGTTVHSSQPNTVILTAPYYDPGNHMADDSISALWTTSILFPNTSRDCSHAVLMQNGRHEEATWTFTYDRSFETFRAVRIDDLRNGTTYFTGPVPSPGSQAKLIPCTLPAASYYGELVSAGFQGKEIWLYGVPEDLDAVPDHSSPGSDSASNASSILRRNSGPSIRSASRMQESGDSARVPQWQVLCDKLRNTFVGGCKIGELEGISTVKWVADFERSSINERLVVAARGISPVTSITEDEGIDFVDGGRIILIDFDYGVRNGAIKEISIEVGTREPEILEEEHRDIDTEVAIVRRRTVAQKRGNRSAVMRAATTASRPPPLPALSSVPPVPTQSWPRQQEEADDPLLPRRIGAVPAARRVEPPPPTEEAETESIIEEQEALDAPYSQGNPRSGTTLRRAATAAAVNRRLHPQPTGGPVEYRRADGRAEHPHESDADNWVPPPPPYQQDDPGDTPAFLRHAMPAVAVSITRPGQGPSQGLPQQPQALDPPTSLQQLPRSQTVGPARRHAPPDQNIPPVPPLPSQAPPDHPHRRDASGSTLRAPDFSDARPSSSDSRYNYGGDNIYDVSPPDSPNMAASRPSGDVSREPGGSQVVQVVNAGSQGNASTLDSPPMPSQQTALSTQQPSRPPVLDLHIPSSTLSSTLPTWNNASMVGPSPSVRRLSNANTWPMQPQPQPQPEIRPPVATGYPYSAPPTDLDINNAMARSFPPAPRPDQLASLNNRSQAPQRLSGGFQVHRVPVGSRISGDYTSRPSSYQRPPPQQQPQYPQPQYQQAHPQPQYQYQYQYQYQSQPHSQSQSQSQFQSHSQYEQCDSPAQVNRPQPQQLQIDSSIPQEDMPLIISTPKGVSGAFDPPDWRVSGRRAETQILAPIPRHPGANSQAAVLRPTMERLDTIYSVASNGNQHMAGRPHLDGILPGAPGSYSSTVRVASLSRKQSRVVKNLADARRRGWTGRPRTKSTKRKKAKQKKEDTDAASSAWTDVASFSRGSLGFSRGGDAAAGQQVKGERKCAVM